MKTIVAGSRDFNDYEALKAMLDKLSPPITVLISGGARGADRLGIQYAQERGLSVEVYFPDWKGRGRSAGFKRNIIMAEKAERLVAFWDGKSHGTEHMITTARARGLPVTVIESI